MLNPETDSSRLTTNTHTNRDKNRCIFQSHVERTNANKMNATLQVNEKFLGTRN